MLLVARVFHAIADLIYPPKCPLCDAFVDVRDRPCAECALELQHLTVDAQFPHLTSVRFERCRSCFAYEGKLREALHGFKYGQRLDLLRFLGGCLAKEAEGMEIDAFDCIVPVPMHRRRLRARGFNQAALLSRHAGRALSVPVSFGALQRRQDVAPQVGLVRGDRLANVKGVFAVDTRRSGILTDARVLLIDDILTTGATANECARALRKSGAASVSVLTVARTL